MTKTTQPTSEEPYVDHISLKTVSEMQDPVLTPSGSIYDRADIERWIAANGHDPITRKSLTKKMLCSINKSALVGCDAATQIENLTNNHQDEITDLQSAHAKIQTQLKTLQAQNKAMSETLATIQAENAPKRSWFSFFCCGGNPQSQEAALQPDAPPF